MKNHVLNKIVISGMGMLSAGCNNVAEFKEALYIGESMIHAVAGASDDNLGIKIGALIDDRFSASVELEKFAEKNKVLTEKAKKLMRKASLSEKASIISVLEAWNDAGLNQNRPDPERISVIIGGSNLTKKVSFDLHDEFVNEPCFLTPKYAMNFLDTEQVGIISELFEIKGEGFSIGGASASGNAAIIKGMQMLRAGIADVCVVVGTLVELSAMEIQGFMNIGALAGKVFSDVPEQACRPFDKRHEGFVYGQGCGCIILETEQSALSRKKKPYALLLGGAMCLDGNHLTNPDKNGEIKAMQKAIYDADVKKEDIDYLNTHGSSSKLGDDTELESIKEFFGDNINKMYFNSTKGITGHCLFAAGVIEAIATVIQINDRFIHKNINLKEPVDPEIPLSTERINDVKIKTALSNSFGFSGINTAIVIQGITEE